MSIAIDLDDAGRVLFRHGLRNVPVVDDKKNPHRRHLQPRRSSSGTSRGRPRTRSTCRELPGDQANITIVVKRRLSIEDLRPTQHKVYADELFGRMEESNVAWWSRHRGPETRPAIFWSIDTDRPWPPRGGGEAVRRVRRRTERGRRAGPGTLRRRAGAPHP